MKQYSSEEEKRIRKHSWKVKSQHILKYGKYDFDGILEEKDIVNFFKHYYEQELRQIKQNRREIKNVEFQISFTLK